MSAESGFIFPLKHRRRGVVALFWTAKNRQSIIGSTRISKNIAVRYMTMRFGL
jgi:hypothetical protein